MLGTIPKLATNLFGAYNHNNYYYGHGHGHDNGYGYGYNSHYSPQHGYGHGHGHDYENGHSVKPGGAIGGFVNDLLVATIGY